MQFRGLYEVTECQFYWQMLEHHNDGAWDEVLAGQATLRVCSEPEGATVSIRSGAVSEYTADSTDWRAEGRTPLVLPELPAGLLLLTLEHPLFPLAVRSVFLRGGTEREIAVDFRSELKEEPSDTGSSRG